MDDRLRALERAARADPSDRAAGWAFVAALDQAGDEVGAWRERCRLARAGDAQAWTEVDRPIAAGVRALGPIAARTFDGDVRLVTTWRDVVVLEHGGRLLGLEAATLETRWSRPSIGVNLWVGCGPRVVAPDAARELLVHVSARGGDELQTELPVAAEDWWPCRRTADRLMLVSPTLPLLRGHGRVAVVDVGDPPGAVLADVHDTWALPADPAVGGVHLHQRGSALQARDVVSRALLWSAYGHWTADVDPRHALALSQGRLALLEVRTGNEARAWSAQADRALLAPDAVVARVGGVMVVFDRGAGAERWRRPRPPGRSPALAAARDVLVVAFEGRYRGGQVVGLDLTDGRPLWTADVRCGRRPSFQVALAERAVVAVASTATKAHLVRIAAPDAPSIP